MTTSDLATQAVALLGPNRSENPALRRLETLVRDRLAAGGGREAYEAFLADPADGSLVRHLLREQARRDAAFARRLDEAVEQAGFAAPAAQHSQSVNASGGSRVALAGRDVRTSIRKRGATFHFGGVVLLIAVIAALVLVGWKLSGNDATELTADSTCAEFNAADPQTQRSAVLRIAEEMGVSGLGNPLIYPNVPTQCSYNPSKQTLGKIIGSMR